MQGTEVKPVDRLLAVLDRYIEALNWFDDAIAASGTDEHKLQLLRERTALVAHIIRTDLSGLSKKTQAAVMAVLTECIDEAAKAWVNDSVESHSKVLQPTEKIRDVLLNRLQKLHFELDTRRI